MYDRAVAAYERALPGWLKYYERRGEPIPNGLACAYLGLNRDADAARVLRSVGLSDEEISSRLIRFRRYISKPREEQPWP
jgi:hypothetical protein